MTPDPAELKAMVHSKIMGHDRGMLSIMEPWHEFQSELKEDLTRRGYDPTEEVMEAACDLWLPLRTAWVALPPCGPVSHTMGNWPKTCEELLEVSA